MKPYYKLKMRQSNVCCSVMLTSLKQTLGVSFWIHGHQCLGSGSELRKSSGLSEGGHQ